MKKTLKIQRENLKLTQLEVASMANMSTRNYQRIESKKQEPKVSTAILIAKVLASTVEELFGDYLLEQSSDNSSK